MLSVKRGGAVLLVTLAWTSGCHDSNGTATSPTSSPSLTSTFSLSGQVLSSDTGASVVGATPSIIDGPNSRTSATSDISGNYTFAALSAANHISQSLGVTLTSNRTLNFSLRPQPGANTVTGRVTDAATDRPIPGAVVSINGRYPGTTDNSGHYTVVETVGVSPCCSERIGNPTTIRVTAGTVIVVNVEMLANSTSAQSFVVSTTPPLAQ